MATIYDTGKDWHLVIAPNAKPVQEINEPSKGYSATLGEDPDTGRHVVMDVHYDKDRYTIGEVTGYINKLSTCPACAALDKDKIHVESIEIPTPQTQESTSVKNVQPQPMQQASQPSVSSPLKDIFANALFDAYFTTPGKYFFGMMLNDDKLLESAMPKNSEDLPQFMDEMIDFLAGKIDFMRSPDEIKDYLSVLKKDDNTPQSKRYDKKRRGVTPTTVIY